MQNKYIKGSYFLSIALIASVVITGYLFIRKAIHQKEMDAYIINLAGTQGMLSQKITQLSLRLITTPEEAALVKSELKSQLTVWKHSHHSLRFGDVTKGFTNTLNTDEIDSLYNNLEPSFLSLINNGELLLQPQSDTKSIIKNIIFQQDIFMPKMKAIVDAYEHESDKKLQDIHTNELIFFIIGIPFLLIINLLIFLPIFKRNDRLIKEIRNKSELLTLQNSILQKAIENEKETKAAIKLSEEKFRFIAENTSDGIIVFEQGKVTYTSPSCTKLFGYSEKESLGLDETNVFNTIHPEDNVRVKDILFEAIAAQKTHFNFEFRTRHKNGHYIWREDTITIIYDKKGELLKAIIVARDISGRKEYEKTSREREQLLSSIFNTVTDLIFVLEPDGNNYSFAFVNKAFETTTGISVENIVGKHLDTIFPTKEMKCAIEKIDEAIQQQNIVCWQTTIPIPIGNLIGEISITPVVAGKRIKIIGSIHNLSERVKSEEALKQSHSRLKKLTEKIPEAIYELHESTHGVFQYQFLSQFVTQLMPDIRLEDLQKDANIFFENIILEDLNRLIATFEISRINLTAYKLEFRVINPDGSIRWIKDSAHPERLADGSTVWYGHLEDISQQKEEEKRLQLFQLALSNSSESIMISEVDSKVKEKDFIFFANDAFFKMTGYSRDDFHDGFLKKLRGEKTDFSQIKRLEDAIAKGEPCEIQVINYKKSGEEFIVNISISPVQTHGNEQITHWISIQRDITTEKRNIENIESQNKLLTEIAWLQSHVIRSPLAKLMGLVNLLKKNKDRPDRDIILNHLDESAAELDLVIRDIVDKTDQEDWFPTNPN